VAAAAQIEPVRPGQARLRFPVEYELLLACARPALDHEPELSSILVRPLDWDRVLRLAERHRLLPALNSAVHGRNDVPASIRSAIVARFERHERKVLRFTAELVRILRQFDRHRINVLAHKGAALGQLLYGDPAMRQFGDLDFLVRAADLGRARSALTELGYAPKLQLSPRQEKEYLRSGYEHVFGLGTERNLVEVQWQIVPHFYAIDFDIEALFSRSVELDLNGLRMRALCDEDQMLVLCVHAAKHEWVQLGMLRDIATLALSDLDWEWIIAEARRLGIVRILAVSLQLASNLFALHVPALPRLQAEIGGSAEIAIAIQTTIISGAESDTESLRYFHAFMHLRERWQDCISMAWRLATTPSVGEWQSARLPDPLFTLYRGVRLLRLLRRFCFPKASVAHASPTE
jgi:Uncharacterised nucleotidyltransferase